MKKWLFIFLFIFLSQSGAIYAQAGFSLKTELSWPFRAILNPGLIPLHLEAELSDPRHRFAVSGIVRYFHYDGEGDLEISPDLPVFGPIVRNEFNFGLGVRCYPVNIFSETSRTNFSFFVEPQIHYRYLQDSLIYIPWNFHSNTQTANIRASFKVGYQKVFFNRLIVEPGLVLGYFPDFVFTWNDPVATLNLMVGYRFNRMRNGN
jgi:hypothetical protein